MKIPSATSEMRDVGAWLNDVTKIDRDALKFPVDMTCNYILSWNGTVEYLMIC